MLIRSKTIRLGIFISTLVTASIVIFQLVWLRKLYHFEQKQFDHTVIKALRGFYEDMNLPIEQSFLNQLISIPNNQIFLAQLSKPVSADSTVFYMHSELEDENIFTDCILGVYSTKERRFTFTSYLPASAGTTKTQASIHPVFKSYDYLALYFPHRERYILSQMNLWIIGSAFLLFVLVLFGACLYYFYREKFLHETQRDFVNNFTHEFKTPVAVIHLAADVLASSSIIQKPERLKKYAAIVQYQVRYLQEQIEKLLQYSGAERNLLLLRKQKVDVHTLIDQAIENLHPLIQDKKAEVTRYFDAKQPWLFADRDYLLIMITNLIENALKYSSTPRIHICTESRGNNFMLSVKDNGKGIEKKYRQKIFKKFYRVPEKDQMQARGFGLGLAFVNRIVQAHAGSIEVESVPGIGSDFKTTFPIS